MAHAAYLLTLEPHFIDSNALCSETGADHRRDGDRKRGKSAPCKQMEILERINQIFSCLKFCIAARQLSAQLTLQPNCDKIPAKFRASVRSGAGVYRGIKENSYF